MYRTVVMKYQPKAKEMAASLEKLANDMEAVGMQLVTFSVTESSKAIAVFQGSDEAVKTYDAMQEEKALARQQKMEKHREDAREWHKQMKEEARKKKKEKKLVRGLKEKSDNKKDKTTD
ncbi:hypothetical protein SAMN02745687_02075 [Lachnospiraceae bacterium NK3A20]|nr:hypothetical protein SAMN02745687_02075 [Lachnospiraceae bacterium NK3A20]